MKILTIFLFMIFWHWNSFKMHWIPEHSVLMIKLAFFRNKILVKEGWWNHLIWKYFLKKEKLKFLVSSSLTSLFDP